MVEWFNDKYHSKVKVFFLVCIYGILLGINFLSLYVYYLKMESFMQIKTIFCTKPCLTVVILPAYADYGDRKEAF